LNLIWRYGWIEVEEHLNVSTHLVETSRRTSDQTNADSYTAQGQHDRLVRRSAQNPLGVVRTISHGQMGL
jgi:hypothetical protein